MPLFLGGMQRTHQGGLRARKSMARARRTQRIASLEPLENRTLLAYTFSLVGVSAIAQGDGTGNQLTIKQVGGLLQHSVNGGAFSSDWDDATLGIQTLAANSGSTVTINTGDGVNSITLGTPDSPASTLFAQFSVNDPQAPNNSSVTIDDSGSAVVNTYTVDTGPGLISGNGINYVESASRLFQGGVTLMGSTANNLFRVLSTAASPPRLEPVSIIDGGSSSVVVGNNSNMSAISAPLFLSSTGGLTSLFLNDQNDGAGKTITLDVDNGSNTGSVTGLSAGDIHFKPNQLGSLEINGGSGGNTFAVNQTPAAITTLIRTGSGQNLVNVFASSGPLNIENQGTDSVWIGKGGTLQTIAGPVTLSGNAASTTLTVDDTADPIGRNGTLTAVGPNASLTGLSPFALNFVTANLVKATILAGLGTDTQTVDFATGNPIPGGGLAFDGGPGNNTLNLHGGSFTNETYTASGPGAGHIALDSSSISFSNLLPINDVVPAANLVFFAPPGTSVLNVVDGPIFLGFQTTQFNSGAVPTFELMNFANKANVTINGVASPTHLTINNPTQAAGLANLAINLDGDADTLSLIASPAGVALAVSLGADNDTAYVNGPGMAAGTTAALDGGSGFDTLRYDAAGLSIAVTAGPNPGEVILTPALAGIVNASNFERIFINNMAPVQPVPGPIQLLNAVENAPLTNVTVGTFTSAAMGAKASDFAVSINWGDGTSSAGIVTQDASNPSVFYITGSHTYAVQGVYPIGITIGPAGSTLATVLINGVPVTISAPPFDPVTTTASANVANAALSVSVFSRTGTAGLAMPPGPIATFIDLGGAHPVADYTATIQVVDANNVVVVSVPAASIVQNGNTNRYTVNAPSFTLPTNGTYTILVTVTDTHLPTPTTATGSAQAVIADAALAGTGLTISPTEGQAFLGVVGSFTSGNPLSVVSDFTAIITWGDGHQTLGTITQTGPGAFNVSGTNTYADAGSYSVLINVRDKAGQTITVGTTANVADAPLTATGLAITTIELQPFQGAVASFTDANPLASVADFTATIDWGDGSAPTPGTISQAANGTFFVSGSHVYTNFTPTGSPNVVTVTINDKGGSTATALGSAIVRDAAVTATVASISAVEGTLFTGRVATFTDAGGPQPIGTYTIVIGWGDGTFTAPTSVTTTGVGPLGITFLVDGSHTYADEGHYTIDVQVTSAGGSSTHAFGTAIVADAPLTGQIVLSSATERVPLKKVTVATFTDTGGPEPISNYNAVINWGDGTGLNGGTVVSDGSSFRVLGTHTYKESGFYPISVTIHDHGGATITLNGTVNVADVPIIVTGHLNPESDTGISQTDGITRDNTPTFSGTSEPGSIIRLFATSTAANSSPFLIGTAPTNAAGVWQITSSLLADGTYTIVAQAVDRSGVTEGSATLSPIVIDTVAPVVTSLTFNRFQGQLLVGFQDQLSGLDQSSLVDGSFYQFTKARSRPGQFLVTGLSASPFINGSTPQTVTVTINRGRALRGGIYTFTIISGGIRDIAGNSLDGEFFGRFPSGNGLPGGNFVAGLNTVHNRIFPPVPLDSTVSPIPSQGATARARKAAKSSAALSAHDSALPSINVAKASRSRRYHNV